MGLRRIRNRDMQDAVVRLVKEYALTMEDGRKGVKLYCDGVLVGNVHSTISDSKRGAANFEMEVARRIRRLKDE